MKTIWKKIKQFLEFFGLIDDNGQLSRTNLLIYIFTIKFAVVPMQSASMNDLAMALGAMGIYMGKKVLSTYIEAKAIQMPQPEVDADVLERMKSGGTNE